MFLIVRAHQLGYVVKYDQINRVYVVPDNKYTGKNYFAGLCGNFNGRDDDDFRRSGNEMADNALSFAKSWADKESAACGEPTDDDTCEKNPDRKAWAQRGG